MSTTGMIVAKKGTDSLYAASKTSATYKTALLPENLRNGSIGVYGLQGVDATTAGNSNKWILITDAAGGAGWTDKAGFTGKLIKICVGVDNNQSGFVESPVIDITKIKFITGAASAAYTKQKTYIGYNPNTATGSLNLSGLPIPTDTLGLRMNRKLQGAYEQDTYEVSVKAVTDEDWYTSLSRLVAAINADAGINTKLVAGIVSDAAAAADPTQDLTVTLGSASASIASADSAYTVGGYFSISGNMYKILAKPTTTTLTLDRPVTEATQTIAAASVDLRTVVDYPTASYTQYGIVINALVNLDVWMFAVQGFIENASIDYYQGSTVGSGLASAIAAMERQALPYRGNMHTAMIEFKDNVGNNLHQLPEYLLNMAGFYDLYIIHFVNEIEEPDFEIVNSKQMQRVGVAFEVPALGTGNGDTATHNQSDFEDIMVTLFSGTPLIAV